MADSQPPQPSEDSMPKHAEVEKVLQVNQVDQPFMPIAMHRNQKPASRFP